MVLWIKRLVQQGLKDPAGSAGEAVDRRGGDRGPGSRKVHDARVPLDAAGTSLGLPPGTSQPGGDPPFTPARSDSPLEGDRFGAFRAVDPEDLTAVAAGPRDGTRPAVVYSQRLTSRKAPAGHDLGVVGGGDPPGGVAARTHRTKGRDVLDVGVAGLGGRRVIHRRRRWLGRRRSRCGSRSWWRRPARSARSGRRYGRRSRR